ncbi:hypothetical protein QWY90_12505 [Flavobacterium paronense]|uniref:Uncharacterized protein n=1 Tax=Flavobacterium paronense TaxID=1392775 RepID=A0ABV5GDV9_9FLAO|nr:hypothetical protein [Flavobacterium paronense]MDN3678128.1 hypothetical protein [Flavobacterium paronense]
MNRIIQTTVFAFFFFVATNNVFAQDSNISEQTKQNGTNDPDAQLKETLYTKYKKEVRSYDKNDFDALFFDFFKKQKDASLQLTQEEFYTYTIKIAIYSEKLGLLYKDQKEEAMRTKQEWFDKSYADYLNSKK